MSDSGYSTCNRKEIPTLWAERFEPRILCRGYDYYVSGRVAHLRPDDGAWHATVAGSSPYSVTVPFEKRRWKPTCSCPHFAGGHPCKHIAAVCYAIQDVQLGLSPVQAGQEGAGKDISDARELVNRLGIEELRDIVAGLVSHDGALARRIMLEYGSVDSAAALFNLRGDLLALASDSLEDYDRYRDEWDIDYDAGQLVNGTVRPLFDGGRLRECADIAVWLPDFLLSFGWGEAMAVGIGALRACLEWWLRILASLAERSDAVILRENVSHRMLESLEHHSNDFSSTIGDESVEKVIALLAEMADDGNLTGRLLAIVDEAIDRHSKEEPRVVYPRITRKALRDWLLLRQSLLRRSGKTLEERLVDADEYLHLFEVASALADEFVEQGEWQRAADILDEGLSRAEDPTDAERLKNRLAHLYEEMGDIDHARALVRELVVRGAVVRDGEDPFLWLRRLTDDETWLKERDSLLDVIPYPDSRRRCLANEGLYERLRDEIDDDWQHFGMFGARNAFNATRRYREKLGQLYPDWMLRLYRAVVLEELKRASGRSAYRDQVELMSDMTKYEGGDVAARQLADEIRATYPRRSALKDELARAGFRTDGII